MHGQIRTQAAADGSSYLELGNTKVLCTVAGPAELRRSAQGAAAAGSGGGGAGGAGDDSATITVDVNMAGFSGLDRKKRARNDKYVCLSLCVSLPSLCLALLVERC